MNKLIKYFRYLRSYLGLFIAALSFGLLYSVSTGAGIPVMMHTLLPFIFRDEEAMGKTPAWMQDIVANWFQNDAHMLLLVSCAMLPVFMLLRAVSGFCNVYLMTKVGIKVVEDFRYDVYKKLLYLPMRYYQKQRSGDLLARVMGDSNAVKSIVVDMSNDLIKQPFTLIAAIGSIVYFSFQNDAAFFSIVGLFSVPLCVFPIRFAGKKLASKAAQSAKEGGALLSSVTEAVQSPIEIKSYNLEEYQLSNFSKAITSLNRLGLKMTKYNQMIRPSIEYVAACGFVFALYLGASRGMSLESFAATGMALYFAYEPVKKLGGMHAQIKAAGASIDRLEEILFAEDDVPDASSPQKPPQTIGDIRFDKVSFAYTSDEMVMKDVDIHIKSGETIALIGPSGAGKTSFVNLLPRLYDPTKGGVYLDGLNLKEWDKKWLREQIAIVPQVPLLFQATIAENIRLGRPGATDEEVYEAARKAYAHDFISSFPEGYETMAGERGTQISGGQRQRIAIARAFLKNAPVLILDEATSALDNESEQQVQKALQELHKGRTTILIAHRLSTTRIAHRFVYMDRGEIVKITTEPPEGAHLPG